ncbi:class I SAM-dependent methyltransferase [Thermithiobacillus plumbiphilus]|uniref:Ribosomal RNA small subunit methyltransferase J n=1 Tax=Thermithiobacillus plumbiphilus TaxID=1729899 RepID=A0ABU9D6Y8_9PROT
MPESGGGAGHAPIPLVCPDPALWEWAEHFAGKYGFSIHERPPSEADIVLLLTPERLQLQQLGPDAPGPVFVDFAGGRLDFRRRHGGGVSQPLARAVGLKGGERPLVLDATAGLGRDAFVLASLGCRITLLERQAAIAALLADGLERAAAVPELAGIVAQMTLRMGEGAALMQVVSEAEPPDTIYLDPMYPPRNKHALVKKEMQLLHRVVGQDLDAASLLEQALHSARKRVVVKRPRLAEPLSGPTPTFSIDSPNTRYDVYLRRT